MTNMKNMPSYLIGNNKSYALGRLKSGIMNKTEQSYANHLELLKQAGDIVWYKFEGLKFKLAENTSYTPDFSVMTKDSVIEIHEIKGFWQEDAKVKIKVAASMYPFKFIAIKANPKSKGGGWSIEEF